MKQFPPVTPMKQFPHVTRMKQFPHVTPMKQFPHVTPMKQFPHVTPTLQILCEEKWRIVGWAVRSNHVYLRCARNQCTRHPGGYSTT